MPPKTEDIPEAGMSLEDLFVGRSVDVGKLMVRLQAVACDKGLLPLSMRRKTYNTRLAQESGRWAGTD